MTDLPKFLTDYATELAVVASVATILGFVVKLLRSMSRRSSAATSLDVKISEHAQVHVGGDLRIGHGLDGKDVRAFVADATAALRASLAGKEQELDFQRTLLEKREELIRDLMEAAKQPNRSLGVAEALAELRVGREDRAVALLEQTLRARKLEGRLALTEAAAAADHLGWLLADKDFRKAAVAFREALTLNPSRHSAWTGLGHVLFYSASLAEAEQCFRKALSYAKAEGNAQVEANALGNLARVALRRLDADQAETLLRRSMELHHSMGDEWGVARNLGHLALAARVRGDLEAAEKLLEDSRQRWRAVGDPHGEAVALGNLALLCAQSGRGPEAARLAKRSLRQYRKARDRRGEGRAHGTLAQAFGVMKRVGAARRQNQKSLRIAREMGDRPSEANALAMEGNFDGQRGCIEDAERALRRAIEIEEELEDVEGLCRDCCTLGMLLGSCQRFNEALDVIKKALALSRERGTKVQLIDSLLGAGRVSCSAGDATAAEEYFKEALATADAARFSDRSGKARARLASIYLAKGDWEAVIPLVREATSQLASESQEERMMAHGFLGIALYGVGRDLDEAEWSLRRAIELYNGSSDPPRAEAFWRVNLARVLHDEGKLEEAVSEARAAQEIFDEENDLEGQGVSRAVRGWSLTHLGDPAKGVELLREACDFDRRHGHLPNVAVHSANLAIALGLLGRESDALEAANRARTLFLEVGRHTEADRVESTTVPWIRAHCQSLRGESPGQVLTPRNAVSFPAGTTFGLDAVRIVKLLEQATVSEDERAEIVGTLTLNGTEHKFSFFEVGLLPGDLIDEWKREMSVDRPRGWVLLLAELYLRRYPCDESERIAHPGALAVSTPARSGTEE